MAKPSPINSAEDPTSERLNAVYFALCDPVRRAILERLDEGDFPVSEIAAPFDISLQAVSKHIQVSVRSGLGVRNVQGASAAAV